MRSTQKQIVVLVLLVASVAILARQTQSFGKKPAPLEDFVFSQRPKLGFTIWGIQPGDSVPEILRELPANTKTELTERLRGRNILLHGPRDRTLQLTTVEADGGEFVEQVRVDAYLGGLDLTTLELRGNPVLHGRRLKDDDLALFFPGAKQTLGGFEAIKFGQRIRIGHDKNWLNMIELTPVDTAPRESE